MKRDRRALLEDYISAAIFAGLRRASEDKKTVERQEGCGETSVTPRGIKEGGNSTAVCEVGCEQQPSLHLCGRARVCV